MLALAAVLLTVLVAGASAAVPRLSKAERYGRPAVAGAERGSWEANPLAPAPAPNGFILVTGPGYTLETPPSR